MSRVVCLGDLMVDVVAQLPGPLARGSDTPAVISTSAGGSAANTAAWLVAAGCRASLVARVGADDFGRRAMDEIRSAGVDLVVSVDPVRPTGTCIVLVDPFGERTMIPDAGANAGLGEVALSSSLFDPGSWLHLSGYALFNEGSRPAAHAAIALARRRGCPVSVDAASAAPLAAAGAGALRSWVGPDVLLFANSDEARVLTGSTDPEAAARQLGDLYGSAVVKRGPAGACWSDGAGVLVASAEQIPAVDTTGAGDAFAAGFLSARLGGGDVATSLRTGTALAARAITRFGARP